MTQIAISDNVAKTIAAAASHRGCTAEELVQHLVTQMEDDDALADRILTPAMQTRMLQGAEQVKQGHFIPEEEVDRKFDDLFHSLETR